MARLSNWAVKTAQFALIAGGISLISGCVETRAVEQGPPDATTTLPLNASPDGYRASGASLALRAFYNRAERQLLARGKLRRDGETLDPPADASTRIKGFEEVAFFDEFSRTATGFSAQRRPSAIKRWDAPVQMQLHFGPSMQPRARRSVTAEVTAYASRLADITGHPIQTTQDSGNFHVFFVDELERQSLAPLLAELAPGFDDAAAQLINRLGRSDLCLVVAYNSPTSAHIYDRVITIIRAELPPLMRSACIHEELAQGLGLANDSPDLRPSVFNDDDEFAYLTALDETYLRLLYSDALSPGMQLETARPIVTKALSPQNAGPV